MGLLGKSPIRLRTWLKCGQRTEFAKKRSIGRHVRWHAWKVVVLESLWFVAIIPVAIPGRTLLGFRVVAADCVAEMMVHALLSIGAGWGGVVKASLSFFLAFMASYAASISILESEFNAIVTEPS